MFSAYSFCQKKVVQTLAPVSLWIVKPGSLGDIVHSLPCAAAIRKKWPHVQISWVIDPRWALLLDGNSSINHRILFPRQNFRGWKGILHIAEWINAIYQLTPPDICLDLQGLLRSALIARCSRSRRIIGLSDAREAACLFYHHIVCYPTQAFHAVDRNLSILSALGVRYPTCPEFPLPSGSPPKDLPTSADWILLHPFARGTGKSLTEATILQFCECLDSLPILIAGMGKIYSALPSHCISLLNQTSLLEMVWLCSHAKFIVSVDSGLAHIAAAICANRLLSLHTWSDPRRVGPYSSHAWIWQGGKIRKQNLTPHAEILPARQLKAADMDNIIFWLKEKFI